MKLVSVDLQKDFTEAGGIKFHPARTAPQFIRKTLIPFLQKNELKVAEIVSDDRLPRPGEIQSYCIPGTTGFQSELPSSVKLDNIWIKALYSPDWIRENIGIEHKNPGKIYQDSEKFTQWIYDTIGTPSDTPEITLFGLTLDCCVLCTAQQFYFRGYKINLLEEAVDLSDPSQLDKHVMLRSNIFMKWASPISWDTLKKILME